MIQKNIMKANSSLRKICRTVAKSAASIGSSDHYIWCTSSLMKKYIMQNPAEHNRGAVVEGTQQYN